MRRAIFLLLLPLVACGGGLAGSAEPYTAAPAREWKIPARDVTLFARSVGGEGGGVLVVLHGGPGLSHDYLVGLDRLAGRDRRVVYYDQRGCGRSTTPVTGRWGLDAQVADLEALRGSLGVDKLDLIGHSWGGLPAMAYAAAHPDRVAHLILVDSIPPAAPDMVAAGERFDVRRRKLVEEQIVPEGDAASDGDDCRPRLGPKLPVYFSDPHHPNIGTLHTSCSASAGEESWRALGRAWDLRADLARLSVPTLAVTGADDPFGPEMTKAAADAIPGARFLSLPSCGHFPYLECPEPFFRAVDEFLRK